MRTSMFVHELLNKNVFSAKVGSHFVGKSKFCDRLGEARKHRVGSIVIGDFEEGNRTSFAVDTSVDDKLPCDEFVVSINVPE